MAKVRVLKKKGKPEIKFNVGGLHQSLGVAAGNPIPGNLMQAALSGAEGEKARKQAQFKKNILTGRK